MQRLFRTTGAGKTGAISHKPIYATFTKIITSVNSTSDSMKARPRMSATMIPGRAAGFRPSESQAAPATYPWPSAAKPAANAIAKPEVSATQLVPADAPVVPCANAGTAITDAINISNINIANFRIVLLLINCRQEVVDAVLYGRRLTLNGSVENRFSAPGSQFSA